jgi:hypothetical protein
MPNKNVSLKPWQLARYNAVTSRAKTSLIMTPITNIRLVRSKERLNSLPSFASKAPCLPAESTQRLLAYKNPKNLLYHMPPLSCSARTTRPRTHSLARSLAEAPVNLTASHVRNSFLQFLNYRKTDQHQLRFTTAGDHRGLLGSPICRTRTRRVRAGSCTSGCEWIPTGPQPIRDHIPVRPE